MATKKAKATERGHREIALVAGKADAAAVDTFTAWLASWLVEENESVASSAQHQALVALCTLSGAMHAAVMMRQDEGSK